MDKLPVLIKLNPVQDEELMESLESGFLWKLQTKDAIETFITEKLLPLVKNPNDEEKSQTDVTSGVVVYRDLEKDKFMQFTFRGKKLTVAEESAIIVKLGKIEKEGAEPKRKPLTFDEKTHFLQEFVAKNGKLPAVDDIYVYEITKDKKGKDKKLSFRVGKFYENLLKNSEKFQGAIPDITGHSGSQDNAGGSGDGSRVLRGRGGVRVLQRGGVVNVEADDEHPSSSDDILEDFDEPEKKIAPAKKAAKK